MTDTAEAPGAERSWRETVLGPFRTRIFLAIWLASLVSNFGTLIQAVGASWLMTSLARSSEMVALVQAATALPIVLLSLPAGAVADIWDRRSVMLLAQGVMLCVAGALTVLAWQGAITPWSLLGLTFLLGCGHALYAPAWQSSVGEQVPHEQLPNAIALNSLGFNIARTAGPAFGGAIVAAAGPPAAFLFNSITYLGLIAVLLRWRRPRPEAPLPPEDIRTAMSAGLRYARLSPVLRTVLARSFVFGLLGSALWALLPLVARDLIGGGPLTYGFLLGAFGGGAVLGVLGSGVLRRLWSAEVVVSASAAAFGAGALVASASPWLLLTMPALVLAGGAWVLTLSTFNIITQTSAPRWVVGRALSIYMMATFGGMALGSGGWGLVAEHVGLRESLAVSGLLLALSTLLARHLPLQPFEPRRLDPLRSLADLRRQPDVPAHAGPVVTTVEYRVARADREAFLQVMHELGRVRRRDGARRWRLLQDLDRPDVWTERWQNATWLEHLRQLQRATIADQELRERARAFHRAPEPPRVRHMLERRPGDAQQPREPEPAVVRVGTTDPNLPAAEAPGDAPRPAAGA